MDPVADLLIRIKNAYMAKRRTLSLPHSKLKENVAKLMASHNFIKKFTVSTDSAKDRKVLTIELLYQAKTPALENLKRISRPGRRIYTTVDTLPWGKTQNTLFIISTSQGLLSQRQAKAKNLGGELMAEVW
jgi:small subunit ribosomal protein S8